MKGGEVLFCKGGEVRALKQKFGSKELFGNLIVRAGYFLPFFIIATGQILSYRQIQNIQMETLNYHSSKYFKAILFLLLGIATLSVQSCKKDKNTVSVQTLSFNTGWPENPVCSPENSRIVEAKGYKEIDGKPSLSFTEYISYDGMGRKIYDSTSNEGTDDTISFTSKLLYEYPSNSQIRMLQSQTKAGKLIHHEDLTYYLNNMGLHNYTELYIINPDLLTDTFNKAYFYRTYNNHDEIIEYRLNSLSKYGQQWDTTSRELKTIEWVDGNAYRVKNENGTYDEIEYYTDITSTQTFFLSAPYVVTSSLNASNAKWKLSKNLIKKYSYANPKQTNEYFYFFDESNRISRVKTISVYNNETTVGWTLYRYECI